MGLVKSSCLYSPCVGGFLLVLFGIFSPEEETSIFGRTWTDNWQCLLLRNMLLGIFRLVLCLAWHSIKNEIKNCMLIWLSETCWFGCWKQYVIPVSLIITLGECLLGQEVSVHQKLRIQRLIFKYATHSGRVSTTKLKAVFHYAKLIIY